MKLYTFLITAIVLDPFALYGQEIKGDSVKSDSLKTFEIDEVSVLGKTVRHTHQKDIYIITPQLQEGTLNLFDLLKKIPGITFDNISQRISVKMDDRVLILVDNTQQPLDFFQTLSSSQIAKVEVSHIIPEKYKIAGYRYTVNVILKRDEGHYLNIQNFNMISPGNNGENDVANEQPKINYLYTGTKLKMNLGYGYADIHWNYPLSYSKEYSMQKKIISGTVSPQQPNDFNDHKSNNLYLGMDYLFNKLQSLYFRSYYSHRNESHFNNFSFYQDDKINLLPISTEWLGNKNRFDEIKGIVGNDGALNEKLIYSLDFAYDYRRGNLATYYKNEIDSSENRYSYWKLFLKGNFDGNYLLNDKITFNFGYSFLWNRYQDGVNRKNLLSENKFRRHRAYFYSDVALNSKFAVHAGLAVESFRNSNLESSHLYKEFLPTLSLSYMPNENIQLIGEFSSSMNYPNQNQLSSIPYQMDDRMWFLGSPTLKPERQNTISLQATLWDNLILGVVYGYKRNNISEFYIFADPHYYKTYINADISSLGFLAMYNWNISKSLTFTNGINVVTENISLASVSHRYTNLLFDSQLSWFIKSADLKMELEYSKSLQRNPLLQGFNEIGQDLWQVSLQKGLLKKKLNISLNYIPPIRWLVHKEQTRNIDATFYKENQSLNLRTYDNLLLLRVTLNLHSGKMKQMKQIRNTFIDEEQKGRRLL